MKENYCSRDMIRQMYVYIADLVLKVAIYFKASTWTKQMIKHSTI